MNETISLIIPVYNVEAYIDQCMQSIVSQTYRDLDIILINDGSTDGSLEVLKKWERTDGRIRVIDKKNEGVSACRNLGITLAKGPVIGFIDPDDWIDEQYVEKLYTAMIREDADLAECDIWRYDNRTGKKIYRSCGSVMGVPFTKEEHMKYGPTASYKSLSRKDLWLRNDIRFPSCSFESPAVYALVLGLSSKTARVDEALYYYRRFRENSLIETGYRFDSSEKENFAVDAMACLVNGFKRCGIYDRYHNILEGIVKYRLSDILAMQFHRRTKEDFTVMRRNFESFCKKTFPDSRNERYITFGGYNLNRILSHMDLLNDPYCRFNFSSVIALSREKGPLSSPDHKNKYRKMMLEREFTNAYFEILAEEKPRYLIMDLIEERFDIIQTGDFYLTKSDAFDTIVTGADFSGRVISRFSSECTALFYESFASFIRKTKEVHPGISILIAENYLSEKVGDLSSREFFDEIENIRSVNQLLTQYYNHIRENYPEIRLIPVNFPDLYFTDRRYEYGAIPSHLNEIVNRKIAKRIESFL